MDEWEGDGENDEGERDGGGREGGGGGGEGGGGKDIRQLIKSVTYSQFCLYWFLPFYYYGGLCVDTHTCTLSDVSFSLPPLFP